MEKCTKTTISLPLFFQWLKCRTINITTTDFFGFSFRIRWFITLFSKKKKKNLINKINDEQNIVYYACWKVYIYYPLKLS